MRPVAAESTVLGIVLSKPEAYWQVADLLCSDDFSLPAHKAIWGAINGGAVDGVLVDAVSLSEAQPALSSVAYELAGGYFSAANLLGYAELVKKSAERRRLQALAPAIAQAETYEDALAILATARPRQTEKLASMRDGIAEMVVQLQRRYDGGEVSGVTSGIESLDAITAGFSTGLIILAARPSMGKSAAAMQFAAAAGRSLVFSMEMTKGQLAERMVSHVGRIPCDWLKFPLQAPDHASARIMEASRTVYDLPVIIDDSSTQTAESISARARQIYMQEPVKLIVIDHLGLVMRPRGGGNDASELGLVTSTFKRLSKDLDVPVILLCQLNRGLEQRADKRPMLSDLRDSGRIEEDADVVIAIYRDAYYNKEADNKAEFLILKQRGGELGTAWAEANLGEMRFDSTTPRPAGDPGIAAGGRGFAANGYQGQKSGSRANVDRFVERVGFT